MGDRHFKKKKPDEIKMAIGDLEISLGRLKPETPPESPPPGPPATAPGQPLAVYCTAAGCVYAGESDGFAMECPECGGRLEVERSPGPMPKEIADELREVIHEEAIKLLVPETDLSSSPPYSVGVFFRGQDASREVNEDNLSGRQALEYAVKALQDPNAIGVEIYDPGNNLIAAGSPEAGLRLIRRMSDLVTEKEEASAEASPKDFAPPTIADVLVNHIETIATLGGVLWTKAAEKEIREAFEEFGDKLVARAVAEANAENRRDRR